MSADLIRADERLGRMPDTDLAAIYGVSRQLVSRERAKKGLPTFRPERPIPSDATPVIDPARVAVPDLTRRRLIAAITATGRSMADVARGIGWTLPQLRRKLAPPDVLNPTHSKRSLFPADVARIAIAIGTTAEAIEAIDIA